MTFQWGMPDLCSWTEADMLRVKNLRRMEAKDEAYFAGMLKGENTKDEARFFKEAAREAQRQVKGCTLVISSLMGPLQTVPEALEPYVRRALWWLEFPELEAIHEVTA